jgi:hypothetical protein
MTAEGTYSLTWVLNLSGGLVFSLIVQMPLQHNLDVRFLDLRIFFTFLFYSAFKKRLLFKLNNNADWCVSFAKAMSVVSSCILQY